MTTEYAFEFQSTIIVARGEPISLPPDLYFEHVLQLQPQNCDTLPESVILKIEIPEQSELFDNEASIYQQLQPLQGNIIPQYLGLASIGGKRAHLLSDIGGMAMIKKGMPHFETATLEKMLSLPVRLIYQHGVKLGDLSMCNVHLCGNAFCIVDLAEAQKVAPEVTGEEAYVREQIQHLVERFRSRQDALLSLAKLARRRSRRRVRNQSAATPQVSRPHPAHGRL